MIDLAEVAYNAYCASVGWKSVRGEDLPAFADQEQRIKDAWNAAAQAVARDLIGDVR